MFRLIKNPKLWVVKGIDLGALFIKLLVSIGQTTLKYKLIGSIIIIFNGDWYSSKCRTKY